MLASRISEFFLQNLVDDPETRRRARILYPSAGLAVLSCVVFFLPLYAAGVMGSRFLILSLFFASLGGTILILVRLGMVRLAGFILVAAFLCVANLQLLKVNGIYGTVYMANLLAVISAGTLFGKRTVLLTAAIAAVSTLGIAWLTSNGAIPSDEVDNPYFEWLRRTSFLFVAVVLHWLGRRGTEKALEESRKAIKEKRSITQSLEQVMEHGDVGHWHWDLQSGRVSWSDNLYRIMGIDRSQFSNSFEGYQDYIHEDDREFVMDAVQRSLESPAEDYHVRHRLRMPDGSIRWLESRGNVVFENHRPLEMAGIVMDITRQKQAQEDLERVYSSLAEGIIIFDSAGDVISMNDSAYHILGWSRRADSDAVIELPVFFDAEEIPLDTESYPPNYALREGKSIRGLLAGIRSKEEVRWLTLNCVPIRDIGTSAVEGAVLSFFDVTDSRNQSTALEKSEEQLRFILENQPNAVLLLDLEWRILYINQLHGGYSLDQVIGKNALDFVPPDDRAKLEQALQRVSTEGRMVSYDIRGYNAGGGLSWYSSRLGLLRHQDQKRIIMISTDITDRVQAELNLKRLAYTDVLSGLPNRQALYDHLSETLEKEDPGFLLFIDLDHFKNINDTLGHDVGDRLLQIVSQRFSELADEPVFLSRLGGDEFMMVMRSSDPIRAEALSRQVLDVFYGALQVRGHELYLSASIGICRFPADGTDIHQLIKNADAAMYRAKAHGRNRFKWFESSMESEIQSRLILDTRLRTAIPNNELWLAYQPVIDLKSGSNIGLEALLRWDNMELGSISPEKFIPLAEETGSIRHLDQWVLRTGLRQLHTWKEAGLNPGRLAVNISVRQLENNRFVEELLGLLEQWQLDGSDVALELTETSLMKNIEAMIPLLQELVDAGIELMIDDFGTGYSSLNYLKRLPVDVLKIDKSFIFEIGNDESDSIIRAIIGMARNLGLRVIAEGVENKEQLNFLIEEGCDQVQGFLLGPPISAVALERQFMEGHGLKIGGLD